MMVTLGVQGRRTDSTRLWRGARDSAISCPPESGGEGVPVADSGDRFPLFEGFSSWAEYRTAIRRLEEFLRRLVASEISDLREREERLVHDFPSQRALRAAIRRLGIDLRRVGPGVDAPAKWLARPTVGVRN